MDKLQEKYKKEIEEIVFASNRLADLGYVSSHGGNLSYKVDDDTILITPTKVQKRAIVFDDIIIMGMDRTVLFASEARRPTGEAPIHFRFFRKRPDVNGIVHAHPPVLTGFAMTGSNILQKPLLPEPILELGPIMPVGYAEPISEKLADMFDDVIHLSNAFLMKNHGVMILSSEGIERALDLLEMAESTAASVLAAMTVGKIEEIPMKGVIDLENVTIKRKLPIPGDPRVIKRLRDLYDR
jgi:L-fuculose-phosphate aldolase